MRGLRACLSHVPSSRVPVRGGLVCVGVTPCRVAGCRSGSNKAKVRVLSVANGSPDYDKEIVTLLAAKYPNVKCVRAARLLAVLACTRAAIVATCAVLHGASAAARRRSQRQACCA